jgi:N-acetylglutamate synthase-like GNAT family acetyltransferase
MNRDKLPLTLIAFLRGELIGSAALKIREMETHPQYEYWLGSVYIEAQHRGKGYGTELVQAAMKEAARFEIQELYLYTRGNKSFYSNLGWKEIEKTNFRGRLAIIMKYLLQ